MYRAGRGGGGPIVYVNAGSKKLTVIMQKQNPIWVKRIGRVSGNLTAVSRFNRDSTECILNPLGVFVLEVKRSRC